jgi:DNA repair exonuclease SbcCD ATPase subunit
MSETLTYEQMMALFAEGRKETAELRNSIAEGRKETVELRASMEKGFAEGRKETAELRNSIAEGRKETAELRKSMAERDARADERLTRMEASITRLEAAVEKTNVRVDATNARLDKAIANLDENTADLKKNNARLDKNNAKLDKLDRDVGKLNNKLGGIIEHAVLPDIVDKFKEKGFKFKEVSVKVEILNESETKHLTEVDALLENGKFVIAVEAKTDMRIKDVDAHIKRLEILRKLSRFNGKKIYGALATAVARKGPVNYALKHGFYVLQRPDILGVKILDFPKGRSAKAW